MTSSPARVNRFALASLVAAIFTFSSFCIGLAPIPLTAWVCYPTAVILGILALLAGFIAFRQFPTSGEQGRTMALIGMWTGILTILAVLCFSSLGVVLLFYGIDFLKANWPGIKP